jgi:meso-butanediol dehydrogenase / (S,S)-butanediol dehydrogenase / diacetyl reductase
LNDRPDVDTVAGIGTRLAGRVALISGSTRGIGRSIAELFASEGAKVGVTGRTADRGQKVVQRIRESGGEAEYFSLDVTDESNVRDVVEAVAGQFGSLTTLINNAAPTAIIASGAKPLAEFTTDEWNEIMTGTLTGNVFWATKYAWPHLKAAPGATIVNISSGASTMGQTGLGVYAAAKGGMNSITRTIAVEGAPHDIRCNAIIVGRVVAGSSDSGAGMIKDQSAIGNPMQIANTALFLSTDDSSFINGDLITADGGMSMNGDVHMA